MMDLIATVTHVFTLPQVCKQFCEKILADIAQLGPQSPKSPHVSPTVARKAWGSTIITTPKVVRLFRGASGLGMSIRSAPDVEGVTVSAVVPGKCAALSGQVNVGDIITTINGLDIRSMAHSAIVDLLRSSLELEMVVKPLDGR